MSRRKEIVSGQIFRRIGGGGGVWRVLAVRKDGSGAPHAMMCRDDDPNTLKTLSIYALQDGSQFQPLEAE